MNSRSRLDERLKSSEPSAARFICCAVASLFLIPIASAQVTSGSITGTARDSSGAVIPGASITVTNLRTNAVRATLTDADGNYLVPGLLPSGYSLKAEKPGFKTFLAKEVVLPVGGDIRVDFALEVGQVTEQVTVDLPVA